MENSSVAARGWRWGSGCEREVVVFIKEQSSYHSTLTVMEVFCIFAGEVESQTYTQ